MGGNRVDVQGARSQLAAHGWIARNAESFRHLPPPAAAVWLGDEAPPAVDGADTPALAGAGWTLHPIDGLPQGRVDARWLDAADAAQRSEMFAGLALPGGAEAGLDDDGDATPFAWAHRALCRHGLRLRIGGNPGAGPGAAQTVWLQLRHQPRAAVEAPLLLIDVPPGVHCVLVETHERGPREAALRGHEPHADAPLADRRAIVQNLRTHVRLGAGATLQHLRVVVPGAADRIAHLLHARLAAGARYDQALIASGSDYHLQRSAVELAGEHAALRIAGLLLAAATTLDAQVRSAHGAPHTSSEIEGLALASGPARAVLNAHTRIAPGADEAATRQHLVGIPTAGQPRLVLRPHLEIHHDKVQASHGAAWGALPEDALFYARQRGLDEASARGLIIEGMASALLERCLGGTDLPQTLALAPLLARLVAHHLAVPTPTQGADRG